MGGGKYDIRRERLMTVRFTVPGEPQGKGRPRFNRYSGAAYTPDKTASYEALVKLFYRHENPGKMFPEGAQLKMKIQACFGVPKSASRKKHREMVLGDVRPTKKPDADNIIKVVCDALNGVAYKDDAAVVEVICGKYYAEEPCVYVMITDENPVAL